jgi:hypothetical protein
MAVGRRMLHAIVGGVVMTVAALGLLALDDPPADAGASGTCRVHDRSTGVVRRGDGRALREAIAHAHARATLEVSGRCTGTAVVITRPIRIVGRTGTPDRPTTIVGIPDRATFVITSGPVLLRDLRITHEGVAGTTASRGIVNRGDVRIERVTLDHHAAAGGAAVLTSGRLVVVRSTLHDNVAGDDGGGGIASSGTTLVHRSTIARNASGGDGGGIHSTGRLRVVASTIGANNTMWEGGGLYTTAPSSPPPVITLTVFGANQAGASGPDCAGELRSTGYNLVSTTDGGFCAIEPAVGDLIAGRLIDARLQGLGPNGGPTWTQVPGPDSPALDAVPFGAVDAEGRRLCPTGGTDQRGVTLPQGSACDIGAVERMPDDAQ